MTPNLVRCLLVGACFAMACTSRTPSERVGGPGSTRRAAAGPAGDRDAGARQGGPERPRPLGLDWVLMDGMLQGAVGPSGVNYGSLRPRLGDVSFLLSSAALMGPTRTPERFTSREARAAYWLNVYNLTVLRSVVEAPPGLRSVQDFAPEFGLFRSKTWQLDGRPRTLDEIERTQLFGERPDPRYQFALHRAARSAPPPRAGSYDAARLDAQLDEQATRYINAEGRVVVDPAAHTVRLSQFFELHAPDFSLPVPGHAPSAARGPLAVVYTFAQAPLRARLTEACGADGARCTVTYEPFDWALDRAP